MSARPARAADTPVPVRFRFSGCLVSIIVSVVLTVALNFLLYACTRG